MAATSFAVSSGQAVCIRRVAAPSQSLSLARAGRASRSLSQQSRGARSARRTVVRAAQSDSQVDVDQVLKDLQEKWDNVENKPAVAAYAGGAVVALWLSSTLVSAINYLPLIPKVLELVGLGYTAWFVYRYLLFKSSREELLEDIEELKKRISGATQEAKESVTSSSSTSKY